MVCFVKSLILPESQNATCTSFNASELEYSYLVYTYRFELLNKTVNSRTQIILSTMTCRMTDTKPEGA